MCTVPDFKNVQTDVTPSIQTQWAGSGLHHDRHLQSVTTPRIQDHQAVTGGGLVAAVRAP